MTKIIIEKTKKDRPRKVEWPTKEKLIELMAEHKNYCKIARMYNVTDNSVRKWAKKYGII